MKIVRFIKKTPLELHYIEMHIFGLRILYLVIKKKVTVTTN